MNSKTRTEINKPLVINNCPGTLAQGYESYSRTALKRVFQGKKVNHILPYNSPTSNPDTDQLFEDNLRRISISGVQEKFSVVLDKNKLRLANEDERGTYILKPIPSFGKKANQMPANEHLTMQIAHQVYGIDTAENALVFFQDGSPAYITKRFDVRVQGSKRGQEDFASLAERTPQTHGDHYKYKGNYLELFELIQKFLPTHKLESPKLFKQLLFNYLFSNGDAHYKNFSIVETLMGDYKLSPAYDMLNSRIHIEDKDFGLEDGLLPRSISQGTIQYQFSKLADLAGIAPKSANAVMTLMTSKSEMVELLISSSYLDQSTKRNYLQAYQTRLKQLTKNK